MSFSSADNITPSGVASTGHTGDAADADQIGVAIILSRMAEYFDFFVYAIASVLVFPAVFFSFAAPLEATLWSFAVFSLAFVARPVGSLVFGVVDRRFGRITKLIVALFILCGSTMAISFLPTYAQAGLLAPLVLAALRTGQGFGLGGSWDGLVSLLALNAPEKHRGWYAMMPQIGAAMGFGLASAIFIVFLTQLSQEEFLAWGWRFPFFVALALNVLALFARLRLIMTPEVSELIERHELQPRPVLKTLAAQPGVVIAGAFVPLASFALFHLVTVFPLGWVTLYSDQRIPDFLFVQFTGAIFAGATIVLSGVLCDRYGRRRVLGAAAILIALFSLAIPTLLDSGTIGRSIFVLVGFSLLGLSFGQASGSLASRFSREHRYAGAAMTADIAWLIGAGFAPLVALWLSSHFGLYAVAAYLLSGSICTLLALVFSRKLEIPAA